MTAPVVQPDTTELYQRLPQSVQNQDALVDYLILRHLDLVTTDAKILYNNIPDYIQDYDASVPPNSVSCPYSFPLLFWLNGVCTILQNIDNWSRDDLTNNLVGWARLFDYSLYYNVTTMDQVRQALMVLPWFAQFTGTKLSQIPNLAIPSGSTDAQAAALYAPYINKWITQITSFNNFERGTLNSFLNLFAIYLSNQSGKTVLTTDFQVLEKTNLLVNQTNVFVTNPYSIIILVSSKLIPSNSYANVFLFSNGTSTHAYSYFQAGGTAPYNYGTYSDYPNSINSVQNFVNYYAPAGLSVTVLTN